MSRADSKAFRLADRIRRRIEGHDVPHIYASQNESDFNDYELLWAARTESALDALIRERDRLADALKRKEARR